VLPNTGDGTEQLLWRLQNGELPPAARAPKVVVLACGTNGKGMVRRNLLARLLCSACITQTCS
jgi:hypothetical protein